MNKLLQRQLQKYFGGMDKVPENLTEFFSVISDSYDYYEKDRMLIERAIDISSKEMIELNNQLRKDKEELAKTHDKVERNERRFRALVENVGDIIFLADKDGKVVYVSPAIEKVIGYTSDEIIGKQAYWLIHPDYVEESKQILKELLNNPGVSIPRSNRFLHKNGNYVWVEGTVINLLNDESIQAIVSVYRDISERKKSEEELKALSERHTLATGSAQIGIWDYDVVNNILIWDDIMYDIFDVPKDKFSGAYEAWSTTVHPDDIAFAASELQEAIAGNKKFHTVFRIIWQDGTFRHIEAHAFTLKDKEGKTLRMIGVNWDITEQKVFEENLKASNKELETFIYKVSHDLRAPLSTILGLLTLSKSEVKSEAVMEYMRMIEYSAKKLDSIIISLVRSIIIKDTKVFDDIINFEELINNQLKEFEYYEGYSKIEMTKTVSFEQPFFSSKLILETLFQNMIENAIKYKNLNVQQSKLNIEVKENATSIIIIFEDNGIGIEKSLQGKIYDMYFRGSNDSKGSGLGLYIVKTGIDKLGGKIDLESEKGKGSKFIISLPKVKTI